MMEKAAIDAYLKTVKALCPTVTDAALAYLSEGLSVSELKAKHFYIQANTIQKNIGFITSGLLRAFYIDENGKDITIRFVCENGFATDYSSFIQQKQSKYYFQCLEKTTIVNIPFEHIQNGYNNFPMLEKYGRVIAEEIIKNMQSRIESFQFYNAEERYLNFIENSPDLFNRVSLSYLSTYLGIERPSLSRIRKKITQK
jgi:CRP/FNR family transcriptional regulator, anaerobic regulatory protein